MRLFPPSLLIVLAAALAAQTDSTEAEDAHLRQSLAEVGASPAEFIRALENHLEKFPESGRRGELERSIVKAAIDAGDDRRTLLYGERVLASGENDLSILERVTRILLSREDRDRAERAARYAARFEEQLKALEKEPPRTRRAQAQWRDELDRSLARARVFLARAAGNLGRLDEAIALARDSYRTFPTAEAARETGLFYAKAGQQEEALPHLADAFSIADPRNTDEDRAKDRRRLGELYRKLHGSEAGLGDLILQAYDRTAALAEERLRRRREIDPNAGLEDPMQFTLSGMGGRTLALDSLRGKVLVLDFWATWCSPCRVQHPLYEEVKKKYRSRDDVVFLSINTDEDRTLVEPFLRDVGWQVSVYFEDGLSRLLRVSSIPTTVIVNRKGEIAGRMAGFVPERFEDMLIDRIEDALRQ